MTDVYVASNMPTAYPRKLQKPSTVNSRVRDTAESFILDSGIGNDDLANRGVLDMAAEYDADYVIAKDYLHDRRRTTESVQEFFDIYETHDCEATPMVPLQPPHAGHYCELRGHDHYVLGGMVDDAVSTADRVKWLREFADEVADDSYVHGLGVGGGMEFVSKVAGKGWLDSIDCSTPEQAALFGSIMDKRLRQQEVREYSGEGAAKRNIPLAEFNSWQLQDVWNREAERSVGVSQY